MANEAIKRALDMIGDAFTPERDARQQTLLAGHRVKVLVEEARYTFPEACRIMHVDAKKVEEALLWLVEDNARINAKYETTLALGVQGFDYMMVGWFKEQAIRHVDHPVPMPPIYQTAEE